MTTSPATGPDDVDVVVIGGGPPGENVAQYAGRLGLRVMLVEEELVGGECSYWACMPSKALLRPIDALALARAVPGAAQAATGTLDVAAVLARRDSFTNNHDDVHQAAWLDSVGVGLVRGRGRLDGPRRVVVDLPDGGTRTITARHAVVLATGSAAAVPPIPGLREAHPWTPRDVTNVHEVPRRVVLLGAGVVAVESATWLRALGAEEVTLCERSPGLLVKMEPFAGRLVDKRFAEVGITVHCGHAVSEVHRGPVQRTDEGYPRGSEVTAVLDDAEIVADEIVVAIGRTPRSAGIGLETVGIEGGSYVETDDQMAVRGVDGEWLYAVGDVTGRALLTHMGKYQARVAGDVIAARAQGTALAGRRFAATSDAASVPQVTFSDPQCASVGLTEAQAREAGSDVVTVEVDIASVAGASLLRDGYSGRAKLIIDPTSETLVGATFVGSEIQELLHSATVALVGRVPLDVLWHAVPSYPTISEVWLRLLEAWRERS